MNNAIGTHLGPRFSEALTFAASIHNEQRRKGTEIPYVAHVLGVASLALEYGADEDEAIAALLHDGPPTDDRTVGDALWGRFNPEAGLDGTLGYYRGLVTAYGRRVQQVGDSRLAVLVEALEREVSALEDLIGTKAPWPPAISYVWLLFSECAKQHEGVIAIEPRPHVSPFRKRDGLRDGLVARANGKLVRRGDGSNQIDNGGVSAVAPEHRADSPWV